MYQIISKKKRGLELSSDEIKYVVENYTKGLIPDYQMSAFLMAVCLKGMNREETYHLTMAMAESGDILKLDNINKITADKHSTGGVGDKTSLIVGPIVAANDVAMAKMSGRGLGHTGGTIDKLESIPGLKTEISEREFIEIVNKTGLAIIGQSADLAPADKKIYALRDVTATVDNISLISSSIMSKKLAAGSRVIVLDVKTGSGAFMKKIEESKELAEIMVEIGKKAGRKMYALISDMNQPLGEYVGNKLEVYEAVKTLMGEGAEDLKQSSLYLSALILCGAGKADNLESGYCMAEMSLKNGDALNKFKEFVIAQHGDISFMDNLEEFCNMNDYKDVYSDASGFVTNINTELVGLASMYLGGGRATKEDVINPEVGLKILKKIGDKVSKGEPLVRIYSSDLERISRAETTILDAYSISESVYDVKPHIYGYYDDKGYHIL